MDTRDKGKPTILILEDADDALIARDQNLGAKASLAAMLNLSDGILGAVLDLRIIATTNQKIENVDNAILRPGRLLERMGLSENTSRFYWPHFTHDQKNAPLHAMRGGSHSDALGLS
jgi:SpoVK/Ycf46/Vps4 family AAA+-type ATPase